VATITNIALDVLFVVRFGWGIKGAAWATVLSQALSFGIGARYMVRAEKAFLNVNPRALLVDRKVFSTMMRIGLPSGIQHSFVSLGFIALTRIVAPFGADVMAGFTAASRLDSFASMPAMNLAMALSMFVGQNLGACKAHRVRRGFLSTLVMAGALSGATTVVMVVWGPDLVRLFTADAAVIAHGSQYLVIVSLFYVLFAGMFVTGGVLRGAGDTLAQMFFTLMALWVVRIPAAALLSSRFGPPGIWWGIPAGWVVGFTLSFAYYLTGRWKRKVLVRPRG
ncbi:MATE family efflux transporter, partial [Candidatus Fermentibacteria bacterium]|nr:MATE family efflux transporter [Candidatus Fermentibacteria bacterium]